MGRYQQSIVQITRDGGATGRTSRPPGLAAPVQIIYVEASHHDPATAYVTVGATRESTPPYVASTHDYGRTMAEDRQRLSRARNGSRVCAKIPSGKGLLYAGPIPPFIFPGTMATTGNLCP